MRYHSTRGGSGSVGFAAAALEGLAPDGGLFVPEELPRYRAAVAASLASMDFCDVAFETVRPFVGGDVPDAALQDIVRSAFVFGAPLVAVGERPVAELFHGPTAAFKDFGARFMARVFSWLRRGEDRPLNILVATSGDTGGAVAEGFFGVPGISVTVLYPAGRVSPLQERQIAGLGGNVRALAVRGSFDDCQRMVKAALADAGLRRRAALSSANSINIARLVPQAAYHAAVAAKAFAGIADADLPATPRVPGVTGGAAGFAAGRPVTLCVPSGNFGNLTAGLYAMGMGAPVAGFVAATNANRTVPDYLASGEYRAAASLRTLSTAMDVGDPSNFERMTAHFSLERLRRVVTAVSVGDGETGETISRVRREAGYFLDPHSAVGWNALDVLTVRPAGGLAGGFAVLLSTAHPAKFGEVVTPLAGPPPEPPSLSEAMRRTPEATEVEADLSVLGELL